MSEQKIILRRGVEGLLVSILSFAVIWGLCGFLFYIYFVVEKTLYALIPAILLSCFGLYFFVSFIQTLGCPKVIITAVQDGFFIKDKLYRFDEIVDVSSHRWGSMYGLYNCGYLTVKTKDRRYVFGVVAKVLEAEEEIKALIDRNSHSINDKA